MRRGYAVFALKYAVEVAYVFVADGVGNFVYVEGRVGKQFFGGKYSLLGKQLFETFAEYVGNLARQVLCVKTRFA